MKIHEHFFKVSKLHENVIVFKLKPNKTRHFFIAFKSIVTLSIIEQVINFLE